MAQLPHNQGMESAQAPAITVAAVARRLGVSPATLRTWDRRYGVGPSEHSAGAHRRYSPDDLQALERMQALIRAGVSTADAARAVLSGAGLAVVAPIAHPEVPSRPGGGAVISVAGATPSARGLARAAMCLDGRACVDLITESLRERGAVWTWDEILIPVLTGLGQRWNDTGGTIETEHLVSESVKQAFGTYAHELVRGERTERVVLLAAAPDEPHNLPLWALAAALAERSVVSVQLGSRLPVHSLTSAVKRTGPAAVFVWSQTDETGHLDLLEAIPDSRRPPLVLVGGPGWDPHAAQDHWVGDLSSAVTRLVRAVVG